MTMMHLDDSKSKSGPDFRFASEPKERVHASGIITAQTMGIATGVSTSVFSSSVWPVVPMISALRYFAQSGAGGGGVVQTEINDGITIGKVIGYRLRPRR